jgi:hypothetical protein
MDILFIILGLLVFQTVLRQPHRPLKPAILALAAFSAMVPVWPFMPAETGEADPESALVTYHPLPGVGILGLAIHAGNVVSFHISLAVLPGNCNRNSNLQQNIPF